MSPTPPRRRLRHPPRLPRSGGTAGFTGPSPPPPAGSTGRAARHPPGQGWKTGSRLQGFSRQKRLCCKVGMRSFRYRAGVRVEQPSVVPRASVRSRRRFAASFGSQRAPDRLRCDTASRALGPGRSRAQGRRRPGPNTLQDAVQYIIVHYRQHGTVVQHSVFDTVQ